MHFLVMSPCSCDFLLMSLYIYSNKIIIAVGLTYERLVLDSKLSTCSTIDSPAQLVSIFKNKICHGEKFYTQNFWLYSIK